MIIQALVFYLFAAVVVASAVMVISARNPVHSVLFLILAFFNSAGLFLLLGAEFLAMILVVVYVGAVAVLFLFVVMMLDVDFPMLRQGFLSYLPVVALVAIILFIALLVVVGWALSPPSVAAAGGPTPAGVTNTAALGLPIFARYVSFYQASGLFLLVAMVGAIVLTLCHKTNVRGQSLAAQVARDPKAAI